MQHIDTYPISSVLAGNPNSDIQGPEHLKSSPLVKTLLATSNIALRWHVDVSSNSPQTLVTTARKRYSEKVIPVQLANQHITHTVEQCRLCSKKQMQSKDPFLFIGGDHSSAMGIWSGILNALPNEKRLGLLWFDAHMDAHNFLTSQSGNVHGMPVQALLGEGDQKLKAIYANRRHLCSDSLFLLGIRSFEKEEALFLKHKKVKWLTSDEMIQHNIEWILKTVINILKHCDVFAISLDLDIFDPKDMPAVACREKHGPSAQKILKLLEKICQDKRFIGMEIAEYTPRADSHQQGEKLVANIIKAVFSRYAQMSD